MIDSNEEAPSLPHQHDKDQEKTRQAQHALQALCSDKEVTFEDVCREFQLQNGETCGQLSRHNQTLMEKEEMIKSMQHQINEKEKEVEKEKAAHKEKEESLRFALGEKIKSISKEYGSNMSACGYFGELTYICNNLNPYLHVVFVLTTQ